MKKPQNKRPTVAEDQIEGLLALAEALDPNKDSAPKFTCYQVHLDLQPEVYSPNRVKETRKLLCASQSLFATFLGVATNTVSDWEQGRRVPSDMACRFMDEIRMSPKMFKDRLQNSIVKRVPTSQNRKRTSASV